jgi:hypothetical protein
VVGERGREVLVQALLIGRAARCAAERVHVAEKTSL